MNGGTSRVVTNATLCFCNVVNFVKELPVADAKLFAGPRVRRIRQGLEKTQAAMAEELGISASYLNLIERNGRPLTVQLLLKLAATYGVDVAELQGADDGSVAALREVFADPLLEGELPGDAELLEIADAAPNLAGGVVKLHRAYRETLERLSELSASLETDAPAAPMLPIDVVREAFASRTYCFPLIEEAVARFVEALGEPEDLYVALRQWLVRERGVTVQVLPADTMPLWRRRYDRHSRRLFVSERLSRARQAEAVAQEVAGLVAREAIAEERALMGLGESDEAGRLAGLELARYAALAILFPYARTLQVAERTRFDVERIAARFSASFSQAARRLVSLQDTSRGRRAAPPMFLLEVDHAGNVVRRQGGIRAGQGGARAGGRTGFPASFGEGCPRLPVFETFAQPGRTLVERVETLGGETYLVVARTADAPRAGFNERVRRTAFLLGWREADGAATVYADALPAVGDAGGAALGIGPACRLCEREGCLSRAHPPATRPVALDPSRQGIGPYDFG